MLFIGHDLGTGGNKTVLVDLDGTVLRTAVHRYPLDHPHHGWAEQDPATWWEAVGAGTREVVRDIEPSRIRALGFAGQMLALVPMDDTGRPTRPAISWMDHRATQQARRLRRRLGGRRVLDRIAGGTPTAKDILPKVAWVAAHEPEVHRSTQAYGDATTYLVAQVTGRVAMDPTAAGATGVLDHKTRDWSRWMARLVGLPLGKMPPVLACTDVAGTVKPESAEMLGVPAGIPVAMGMADVPAAAVGSGAVGTGQGHIYLGTSSWLGVTVPKPQFVPRHGIASVPHPSHDASLMIAESETAGACRDWFGAQLGPGEDLDALAADAPPGSDGVLFCPWMFGERSPVADPDLRGAFLNLGLRHGRHHLARAVLEGVALNLAWIVDAAGHHLDDGPLRVIGGGATSDLWLQILADATGRAVQRVANPRFAGATGAALLAAVAVGALPDVRSIATRVRIEQTIEPDPRHETTYAALGEALRAAAPTLSRVGRILGRA